MFKKKYLGLAIAVTLAAGSAQAALETSVTLKNETAYMIKDGIRTGEATSTTDTTGEGKGVYKFENTAKIFLNDTLSGGGSWHAEMNLVADTEAASNSKYDDSLTPLDFVREAYVDKTFGDWDLRIGKQQVVWGTADGIKLLDMINPTNWSEFVQDAPADARVPVWMINAEKYLDNGANIQAIVSQTEANKIAGLSQSSNAGTVHNNSDQGHAFIMKGVDSITGKINGFLNIAPDIGATAAVFNAGFGSLAGFNQSTVGEFFNNEVPGFRAGACGGGACTATIMAGFVANASATSNVLSASTVDATKTDYSANGANANEGGTNPGSAFAYMTDATFATFNAFSGAKSEYRVKHPEILDPNLGFRYKNSTDNGLNYSLNYAYHYDTNPYVDLHWESAAGTRLTQTLTTSTGDGNNTNGNGDNTGRVYRTLSLGSGIGYGGTAPVLVFEEKLNRINSLGASFDTAFDTASLGPVVVRGEFLYNKDEMTPIVDRNKLAYGDLPGGLTMQKTDMFKYVLGADVNVLTDMMVSGQFIQFRNLDYVDNNTDADGNACGSKVNCGRYTGDMATLSLTNGLKQGTENKEFYSLFFSKPFGDSGEGRWNNIFMFEEGGGKWNRFDVEYGFDDQLIGTFEINKYFGDNNTMFGQFENASNVQVGVKYLLQ